MNKGWVNVLETVDDDAFCYFCQTWHIEKAIEDSHPVLEYITGTVLSIETKGRGYAVLISQFSINN